MSNVDQKSLIASAFKNHPYAFWYIGEPSAFHPQNTATLLCVYVANNPSLALSHFGVFIFEVPVFNHNFNPFTVYAHTQFGGMLPGVDNISHITYHTQAGMIGSLGVTTSFS